MLYYPRRVFNGKDAQDGGRKVNLEHQRPLREMGIGDIIDEFFASIATTY